MSATLGGWGLSIVQFEPYCHKRDTFREGFQRVRNLNYHFHARKDPENLAQSHRPDHAGIKPKNIDPSSSFMIIAMCNIMVK